MAINNQDSYDVIVIGAGISGLVAANELRKRSTTFGQTLRILIVEAKDRVGGRTETIAMRTGTGHTDQLDMGGQWVGVTQYHILELLKELHLDIYPQYVDGMKVAQVGGADNIRTYSDAIPNTLKAFFQFSPLEIVTFAMFLHEIETMASKLDPLAPFDTPEAADWDSLTVQEFLIKRSTSGGARCQFVLDTVDVVCRVVYGVASDRLSFLYFLLYGRNCGRLSDLCEATGNGSQTFRIVNGSQQISRLLAENLGWDRIRLGEPVMKIRYGSDGVEIWTTNKSMVNVIKAKRLILAIPPQQVGKIIFEPPLAEDQIQLFASFPSGNLFKFNVTYTNAFWRKKGLSGEIVATGMTNDPKVIRPVSVTYDATTAHGNAALVGFLNTEWCGSDPKIRRDAVLADLASYLGSEALNYIDYVDKSWSEEPFNGGCPVGCLAPGAGSFYASAIRRITGPIHFAGTETARHWMGYMSGAVEAGLRASHEVLSVLIPRSLTDVELKSVTSSNNTTQGKFLSKKRFYKKRGWLTWKTATVGFVVGAATAYFLAKRRGYESPIKIKLIYSV